VSDERPRWWSGGELERDRWGSLVEPTLRRVATARDRDRMPHALLLVGPPGLGRELAAVEAAAMLVCSDAAEPWTVSPCADRVRRGVHPDVVAMLPEGKKRITKIGPIRDDVVEVVGARPYEGLRRVWIFDGVEAEHLPGPSANAFLKTLEEPPAHAVFILLAANPSAVLPTIRSRCQSLPLPGAAALADLTGDDGAPPELAGTVLGGTEIGEVLTEIRAALDTAFDGEPSRLLRLPYLGGDGVNRFELVASVATEVAAATDDTDRGEGLIRLAADLLATDRRARALNLGRDRQLAACLLRWYREL
jgi:DNA polymerase-3 subunit delta'